MKQKSLGDFAQGKYDVRNEERSQGLKAILISRRDRLKKNGLANENGSVAIKMVNVDAQDASCRFRREAHLLNKIAP